MEARCLADLYVQACGKRFRVRNVDTLEDYVVLGPATMNPDGTPERLKCLRLDFYNTQIAIQGALPKYALLSNGEEIYKLSLMRDQHLMSFLAESYRNTHYEFPA